MTAGPHDHFEELRDRINARLRELRTPHAEEQIAEYPWLVGALGAVPSRYMFVAMNPSLRGVRSADVDTVDGGPPDMEAQWWGGAKDKAARCFRPVLHDLGLKTTPPATKGGWNCYITNVVKELNIAADQGEKSGAEWREQARAWSDILRWEWETVKPAHVFGLGGKVQDALRHLQRNGLFPDVRVRTVLHYSARRSHQSIRSQMAQDIDAAVRGQTRATGTGV